MKKCKYCESKKMFLRERSAGRFFAKCDYCSNRNKLAEERNAKILQTKRYQVVSNCNQLEAS